MFDVTNTSREIDESGVDTAILPVGAIEQHGPHLPLSVDWVQAEYVSKLVANRMGALLLPGIPYGSSEVHEGFKGSVSITHESLKTITKDVCLSLISQGFTRIGVLNFHGGNIALKVAVRQVNWAQSEGKAVLVQPMLQGRPKLAEILETSDEDLHAGEMETSIMMYIAPEQVGKDRIDHVPSLDASAFDLGPMKEYAPDGIWGRPSFATAEKGKLLVEYMVSATVEHLDSAFLRFT